MPNCSCIRLSTVQPQHQTYRHSSSNQTLATFTFNILTFISTCYISKHHYSLSFLNRQWVHLPSKRSKTPCHGKRCGNSSIMEAKHTFDSTTHWRWQGTGRDRMIKRKWYWQLLLHIETVECRTQCSLVRGQWRGPAWSWWWAVTRTGSCHSSDTSRTHSPVMFVRLWPSPLEKLWPTGGRLTVPPTLTTTAPSHRQGSALI